MSFQNVYFIITTPFSSSFLKFPYFTIVDNFNIEYLINSLEFRRALNECINACYRKFWLRKVLIGTSLNKNFGLY